MEANPAQVTFALSSGPQCTLHPGQFIGRSASASFLVDDPRVSEAHAMVSLRRGRLMLLSLRRRMRVGHEVLSEVPLRDGITVELADGLPLRVLKCVTPGHVLVAAHPELGQRTLGSVASLMGEPPRVVGRFLPEAPAHVWTVDGGWRLRVGHEAPRPVRGDEVVDVAGAQFRLTFVEDAGAASTLTGTNEITLVTYFDTVEVLRSGRPPALIGGRAARVLSELVSFEAPTPWELVAREVWPTEPEVRTSDLRRRWDTTLNRLRQRLVELGLRSDLIQTDGNGAFRLALAEGEKVIDRS